MTTTAPIPASSQLESFGLLAESLRQSLRLARALAWRDRAVDLTGVQDSMGMICAKALDLAPGEGQVARLILIALRDELDQLSTVLRSVRSE